MIKQKEKGRAACMSLIRNTGRWIGKAAGFVIGEPIKFVGEKTELKILTDIGNGVKRASEFAGDTAGQVAGGAVETIAGMMDRDTYKREQGLGEIGEAVGRSARGIVQTGKKVYRNGKDVYDGIKEQNGDKIKAGASGLITTASVAALAVGVADFLIDADLAEAAGDVTPIDTINSELEGSLHPETNVPYEAQTVELPNGDTVEGVFPDFNEVFAGELPEEMYLASDSVHFSYMNDQLAAAVESDPQLAAQFNAEQLEQIRNGETPDGYVWHHTEVPGKMELVDEEIHAESGHTGGRSMWGGGQEHR